MKGHIPLSGDGSLVGVQCIVLFCKLLVKNPFSIEALYETCAA
jgi:hypothetical protein